MIKGNLVNNEKESYHIQRIFARQVGAQPSLYSLNPKPKNNIQELKKLEITLKWD